MPRYRVSVQPFRPIKGPRQPSAKREQFWPLEADQRYAKGLSRPQKPESFQHPARLWNAHRLVQTGQLRGPVSGKALRQANETEEWRNAVTADVVEFVDRAQLDPTQRLKLLKNPPMYFAHSSKVPTELRKQILFPDFTIALMRTTHLPPRYASFMVPLWFNKLDMKSYLSSLYNVDVLHVRSTVLPAKVNHRRSANAMSQGPLFRPQSKKKMTVELVEPFIWPEPEEDLTPWERDTYYESVQWSYDQNRRNTPDIAASEVNLPHRKKLAEHAKEILQGKMAWKPTWQSIPADVRVMRGLVEAPQVPPSSGSSPPPAP